MTGFRSYSQAGQDRFVHYLVPVNNGFFLDVGSGISDISNTLGLEEIGWEGWLVDSSLSALEESKRRKSKFILADALELDWSFLLQRPYVDYLSLDCEESTLAILKRLPLNKVRFAVITIEHNLYFPEKYTASIREEQRLVLGGFGYELICADVCVGGRPFEDWWVDPAMVDMKKALPLKCSNENWESIMLKL